MAQNREEIFLRVKKYRVTQNPRDRKNFRRYNFSKRILRRLNLEFGHRLAQSSYTINLPIRKKPDNRFCPTFSILKVSELRILKHKNALKVRVQQKVKRKSKK